MSGHNGERRAAGYRVEEQTGFALGLVEYYFGRATYSLAEVKEEASKGMSAQRNTGPEVTWNVPLLSSISHCLAFAGYNPGSQPK